MELSKRIKSFLILYTFCFLKFTILFGLLVAACAESSVPHVKDAAVSLSKSSFPAYFGTVLIYRCIDGFTLLGSSTIPCLKNGSWQSGPPECVGKLHVGSVISSSALI